MKLLQKSSFIFIFLNIPEESTAFLGVIIGPVIAAVLVLATLIVVVVVLR